ncbi:MAG: radical SAM protein [Acidobacteriota bacterium]|nr:radical SAM protein [Acidobacteriota bacterium]
MKTGLLDEGRILLVTPVGYARGWPPLGPALIKAYLQRYTRFRVETLSLCIRFSEHLRRNEPGLVQYDEEMGEWGSSFHEYGAAAAYFGHRDPDDIEDTVTDFLTGGDIFRGAPWEHKPVPSDMMIRFHGRRILDFCRMIERFSQDELIAALARKPFLVGFSVLAQQVYSAALMARWTREHLPGAHIVFGGPAVLARTAPVFRKMFSEVDFFVYGDGEEAMKLIAESIAAGKEPDAPGILGRETPVSRLQQPAPAVALHNIPSPDYEEPGGFNTAKPLTVWFGRGCSWGRCSFCAIPDFQRKTHNRPVDLLFQEICDLQDKHRTVRFRFGDWEVNGLPKDLGSFCERVIDSGRDFEFWAEVNARNLNGRLVGLMKQAGFVSLQVGLESFSEALLRKMKKPAALIDNIAVLKLAHRHRIELFSNLLFNFPGETEADVLECLEMIKRIRHLLCAPVELSLIEFLLEIDADAYRTAGDFVGRPYAFESRCLPERFGSEEPYFLRQWRQPAHPYWTLVKKELDLCAAEPCHLYHRDSGNAVLLEDNRNGSPTNRRLTGLQAEVYRLLSDRPRTKRELAAALNADPAHALEDLLAKEPVVRSGARYLALSLPAPGNETVPVHDEQAYAGNAP